MLHLAVSMLAYPSCLAQLGKNLLRTAAPTPSPNHSWRIVAGNKSGSACLQLLAQLHRCKRVEALSRQRLIHGRPLTCQVCDQIRHCRFQDLCCEGCHAPAGGRCFIMRLGIELFHFLPHLHEVGISVRLAGGASLH